MRGAPSGRESTWSRSGGIAARSASSTSRDGPAIRTSGKSIPEAAGTWTWLKASSDVGWPRQRSTAGQRDGLITAEREVARLRNEVRVLGPGLLS
jgi:hypothetical protein